MRGLFSSFSIALACSALGAGDMSTAMGPSLQDPLAIPHRAIADIQRSSMVGAGAQECMTEMGLCEYGCNLDYAAGAAACAIHGFTAQAAVCHAANSAVYGACLAGCRYG